MLMCVAPLVDTPLLRLVLFATLYLRAMSMLRYVTCSWCEGLVPGVTGSIVSHD